MQKKWKAAIVAAILAALAAFASALTGDGGPPSTPEPPRTGDADPGSPLGLVFRWSFGKEGYDG